MVKINFRLMRPVFVTCFPAVAALLLSTISIGALAQQSREELKQKSNQEVMAMPFDSRDARKAQAYAEDAIKQNVVPVSQPPAYRAPAQTCGDVTTYAYHHYGDHCNCVCVVTTANKVKLQPPEAQERMFSKTAHAMADFS